MSGQLPSPDALSLGKGPQSRPESFIGEKSLLPILGIEPRFLGRSPRSRIVYRLSHLYGVIFIIYPPTYIWSAYPQVSLSLSLSHTHTNVQAHACLVVELLLLYLHVVK